MRAAVRRLVGGVPRCEQFDDPVAGGRLEVAEVLAATISKVDLVIAAGIHLPLPLPSVAGREGVARLANGRRVLFYLDDVSGRFGSLAESCPIDGSAGFELPEGMDEPVALAIGATGLAAYIPLIRHGELRAGEQVLILGATGPVGRLAVQLAKRLGAGRVVAAARREGPLRQLLDHGADEIAVMTGEDDEAVLRKAAEGPYDVVVDYVFGRAFEAALPTTNSGDPEDEGQGGSRYVVVGEFELGGSVRLPIAPLFGLTIRGHQNSAVPHEERRDVFEHLARLAMAGELWTEIEEVALEDVSTAWTRVGSSAHAKVIVRP